MDEETLTGVSTPAGEGGQEPGGRASVPGFRSCFGTHWLCDVDKVLCPLHLRFLICTIGLFSEFSKLVFAELFAAAEYALKVQSKYNLLRLLLGRV